MTTKRTPGPWRAVAHADGFELRGANGDFIADVHRRVGLVTADARLIAAAPELLAALREIACYDPTQWDAATLGNIARSALAKAEA